MTNPASDNNPATGAGSAGSTGFSGQSVLGELRALGLKVAMDEARAMRIKGAIQIIVGRSGQGDYWRPITDVSLANARNRLYSECYCAVAQEIVDADTAPETLEETIPFFLSEYFRSRGSCGCDLRVMKEYCSGAWLEWQGRLLQMNGERASTVQQGEREEAENEAARRQALLADYIRRTGASHRSIYEGDSGICKPDFYRWRKGDLPTSSKTTQTFEGFLRDGKRPAPRRPKY